MIADQDMDTAGAEGWGEDAELHLDEGLPSLFMCIIRLFAKRERKCKFSDLNIIKF